MNDDKHFTGKLLVGVALALSVASLLISSGGTGRRQETVGRALIGNGRGQYGRGGVR